MTNLSIAIVMFLPNVLLVRRARAGSPMRSRVLGDPHEAILTHPPSHPSSMGCSSKFEDCKPPLGPRRVACHLVRAMPTVIHVTAANLLSETQYVACVAKRSGCALTRKGKESAEMRAREPPTLGGSPSLEIGTFLATPVPPALPAVVDRLVRTVATHRPTPHPTMNTS